MSASGGPLTVIRWAREQRAHRRLPRAEGDVLLQLATFSDADGICRPGVGTLADGLTYSREHTHRLLRRLERRGLFVTERRGRAPAVRRLRLEIEPVEQLSLDLSQPTSTPIVPPPETAPETTSTSPVQCDIQRSHQANPQCDIPTGFDVTSRDHTKSQEEVNRGEDAREQTSPSITGIAATLQDVLDVLSTAPPVLLVESMSVNAALCAYPEASGHDHLAAAYTVVSWAHDPTGAPTSPSAPRLLMAALRKQLEQRPIRAARFDRPAAGAAATSGRDAGVYERSVGW